MDVGSTNDDGTEVWDGVPCWSTACWAMARSEMDSLLALGPEDPLPEDGPLTKGIEFNEDDSADDEGGVGADGSGDGAVLIDEAADVPVESTDTDEFNLACCCKIGATICCCSNWGGAGGGTGPTPWVVDNVTAGDCCW